MPNRHLQTLLCQADTHCHLHLPTAFEKDAAAGVHHDLADVRVFDARGDGPKERQHNVKSHMTFATHTGSALNTAELGGARPHPSMRVRAPPAAGIASRAREPTPGSRLSLAAAPCLCDVSHAANS